MIAAAPTLPTGAVLVRLPAGEPDWPARLPALPDGEQVTLTLGRPDLLPLDTGPLRARGYRVVGAASEHRPLGPVVDLLVTEALRARAPGWWSEVLASAERVFDLRLGPVQVVLRSELLLHARALED